MTLSVKYYVKKVFVMMLNFKQFKKVCQKPVDAWTEVLLIDMFTTPLAYVIFKFFKKKSLPYAFTFMAFLSRLVASILFFFYEVFYGGLAFFASIILDGLDGKLSRAINGGKDSNYRGTLDFIFDSLGLSTSLCGLIHFFVGNRMLLSAEFTALLAILYYINVAGTSSKYRLLTLNKLSAETSLNEVYPNNMLVKTYWRLQRQLNEYRLMAHPSSVDAEFLLFVIGPLVGFSHIIFLLCLVIMIIDTVIIGLTPALLIAILSE
jgi:phosphatidylglycerophosphate synthase